MVSWRAKSAASRVAASSLEWALSYWCYWLSAAWWVKVALDLPQVEEMVLTPLVYGVVISFRGLPGHLLLGYGSSFHFNALRMSLTMSLSPTK
jgi:hypothetical protein